MGVKPAAEFSVSRRAAHVCNAVGAAVCLAAVVGLVGCQGPGGAVSVRWRITVKDTGATHDPRDVEGPDGICQAQKGELDAMGLPRWQVHRVQLVLTDPVTGAAVDSEDPSLVVPCTSRERTTPFELPVGSIALSLKAFDPAAPAGAVEGTTPAPTIREIKKAEIVNLDLVEIRVALAGDEAPEATDGGGAADLAPGDLGVDTDGTVP
jgi:hypothetical protein